MTYCLCKYFSRTNEETLMAAFRFALVSGLLAVSMALQCYSGEKPGKHTMKCSSVGAHCYKSILKNGWTIYGCADGCRSLIGYDTCMNDGNGKLSCCCTGDFCNFASLNKLCSFLGMFSLFVTAVLFFA